jgi:hypothetical protein
VFRARNVPPLSRAGSQGPYVNCSTSLSGVFARVMEHYASLSDRDPVMEHYAVVSDLLGDLRGYGRSPYTTTADVACVLARPSDGLPHVARNTLPSAIVGGLNLAKYSTLASSHRISRLLPSTA